MANPPPTARRLILEIFIIVGSILLAFAIDAAWENRSEQNRRDELKAALADDVGVMLEAMARRESNAEMVISGAQPLLQAISEDTGGPLLDSLVFNSGNIFIKGFWAPINQTYEQALSAGDLALIRDPELRKKLGSYASGLEFVNRLQESVTTQYYSALEPFMTEHMNYAQVAWQGEKEGLVRGNYETDVRELVGMRQFFNLLNLKLELELEMKTALRNAREQALDLKQALEQAN